MKIKFNHINIDINNHVEFSDEEIVEIVKNRLIKIEEKYDFLKFNERTGLWEVWEDISRHGSPCFQFRFNISKEDSKFINALKAFVTNLE